MTNLPDSIVDNTDLHNNSDSKRVKTEVQTEANNLSHDKIDLIVEGKNSLYKSEISQEHFFNENESLMWSPAQTKIEQNTKLVEFRLLIEQKYNVKLG